MKAKTKRETEEFTQAIISPEKDGIATVYAPRRYRGSKQSSAERAFIAVRDAHRS